MIIRTLAMTAAAVAIALTLPAVSRAQDADDALDKLLEKLDQDSAPDEGGDEPQPGEVADRDRSLDSLLEKLGETADEPSPDGRRPRPGGPDGDEPAPPGPGEGEGEAGPPGQEPGELEGDEKTLDEHLEEILGRRKRDQEDQQGGDPSGPLAEAIKKMEEVRKRLADTDTGDETRQKQDEVVGELDRILEQLRRAQGQSSGESLGRMSRRTQQAGNGQGQPGQQDQPGATGRGVGPQMPQRPTTEESLANRKDIWGDLPPQLRDEINNISKEEMLDAKRDLITRYFDSVSAKGQAEEPR